MKTSQSATKVPDIAVRSKVISIEGMHCRSCEIVLDEALRGVPGVSKTHISSRKGEARIFFGDREPDDSQIQEAIESSGYGVGHSSRPPFFSRNGEDYLDLILAAILFVVLFSAIRFFGVENIESMLPSSPQNLGIVFVIGAVAGVSTCLALVGGLVLGVSARFAEANPTLSSWKKFRPHLFFHAGRLGAFVIGGGILGLLGSAFSFSPTFSGAVFLFAAVALLLLGIKLLGIFPRIERFSLTLPPSVSRLFRAGKRVSNDTYRDRDAVFSGVLSFFLPCGFTQAIQVFAAGSASAISGALILGVFAVGTAPGLLGIGALASFLTGKVGRIFFRLSGLLVLFFALLTFGNAVRLFSLEGVSVLSSASRDSGKEEKTSLSNSSETSVQVVHMEENARGYEPDTLRIQKGRPVLWIITARSPYSCASSLVVPKLGIRTTLVMGENRFEFTPTEVGTIPFSCSMGMYKGVFIVE
ncbi:MAG: sulfite exporter TauE/SafE family protein [Candidatus Moraniibacteriota bacterium]|nr:MAG: sulfite exporter TauE/SafE family protein [Candidatus Moranbacteria bacterium]